MKKTGVGKRKKLSAFENLCLDFVKSAKGGTAVDYITDAEPSGSGDMAHIEDEDLLPQPKRMKKTAEMWKEKYFASIVNVEEKTSEAGIKASLLNAYHTLLQSIQLEETMHLTDIQINALRSTISPSLAEYPSYLSSYEVLDIDNSE